MVKKKIFWIVSLIILALIIIYAVYAKHYNAGKVYVTSVSSDGNYAITTDLSRKAILWDLKNHKKRVLDRVANIYSAYFVKNSHDFMWQHDTDNEVIIEDVSGRIIKTFNPGFPTYGQVITTNLINYFASDDEWNLYMIKDGSKTQIMIDRAGFFGTGKLFNLTISNNEKRLLTSGQGITDTDNPNIIDTTKLQALDGITLWNIKTGKAMSQLFGNAAKTFATLSPDGKYVVAGDEGSGAFVWNAATGKRLYDLYDLMFGYIVNPKAPIEKQKWNNTGLIAVPKDFRAYNHDDYRNDIFSMRFIDKNHYLRFTTYIPKYAILYKVTDPKPLKYLKLGRPMISVDRYTRDQSIDTSPSAHILVTGKIHSGGILVYKYNQKTQTLKKIWDGS